MMEGNYFLFLATIVYDKISIEFCLKGLVSIRKLLLALLLISFFYLSQHYTK